MKISEIALNGMVKKTRPITIVCILGVASLMALPTMAQDNAPVTLALKFKEGETTKYLSTISMNFSAPGLTPTAAPQTKGANPGARKSPGANALSGGAMTVTQVVKVTKVQKSGAGELQITSTSTGSLTPAVMLGQSKTADSKPTVMSVVCDSLGRTSGSGIANPLALGAALLNTSGLILPNKPMKPGESWTETQKIPSGGSFVTKTTFIRYEQVGNRRTAHLRSVMSSPMNSLLSQQRGVSASNVQGEMTITKDMNFAIAEGRIIKSNSLMDMNMTVNMGGMTGATKGKATSTAGGTKGKATATAGSMKVNSHMTQETHIVE